jgi:hypothetical protein
VYVTREHRTFAPANPGRYQAISDNVSDDA